MATLPFVGRERELGALGAAFTRAAGGAGGVVAVVGESGIGKTRTVREFLAGLAGTATVLWGSCYEGDWQPPFGPWAEALRPLLTERGEEDAPVGFATALDLTSASLPLSNAQERFRLFDAVAQRLLRQPLPVVLVIDDLQWADLDSLQLLRHVAHFAPRARLLVVCTYRELDPDAPRLTDLLGALHREVGMERVPFTGLDRPEIDDLCRRSVSPDLPPELAGRIAAETNGNPFYIREMLLHYEEERTVRPRAAFVAPPGVRQVIGRRINRLSGTAQDLLRYASLLTSAFNLLTIRDVVGFPDDALLTALDEAIQAGLIRYVSDDPPEYEFSHGIVRTTVYEGIDPARRAKMHRRMAERLRPGRDDAEIAAQYRASRALRGAEAGIPFARSAAKNAIEDFAWDSAVRLLRIARTLAEGSPAAERAEILSELAIAEAQALLAGDAPRTVREAIDLLLSTGAGMDRIAGLIVDVARPLKDAGIPRTDWLPLVQQGLAATGPENGLVWARLMLLDEQVETISTDSIAVSRWIGFDPRAVAIARQSGDEDDYARTLEQFDWESRAETDALVERAIGWRQPSAKIHALNVAARRYFFYHGAFQETIACCRRSVDLAARHGSLVGQVEQLTMLASARITLGDFAVARNELERAGELAVRLGAEHRQHISIAVLVPLAGAYLLEGDWEALHRTIVTIAPAVPPGRAATSNLSVIADWALVLARLGDRQGARERIDLLTRLLESLAPTDYHASFSLHLAGALVWEMEWTDLAVRYRALALRHHEAGLGGGAHGSHPLTVARMSALLGEDGPADEWFRRSRAILESAGHRPIAAIADFDEATALLRKTAPEPRAAALLDNARAAFKELGMAGWEQRAEALRSRLGDASRRVLPGGITPREEDVLRLIAAGRTTREIAETLVLSPGTVERHITNLYGKIGARGRADATAFALQHGLLPGTP